LRIMRNWNTPAVLAVLRRNGANINAADCHGWTLLIHAAHEGAVDDVRTLLSAHARVDGKNDENMTALSTAMGRVSQFAPDNVEFRQIVKLLKQAGAK